VRRPANAIFRRHRAFSDGGHGFPAAKADGSRPNPNSNRKDHFFGGRAWFPMAELLFRRKNAGARRQTEKETGKTVLPAASAACRRKTAKARRQFRQGRKQMHFSVGRMRHPPASRHQSRCKSKSQSIEFQMLAKVFIGPAAASLSLISKASSQLSCKTLTLSLILFNPPWQAASVGFGRPRIMKIVPSVARPAQVLHPPCQLLTPDPYFPSRRARPVRNISALRSLDQSLGILATARIYDTVQPRYVFSVA
jgi:hypothetical protein